MSVTIRDLTREVSTGTAASSAALATAKRGRRRAGPPAEPAERGEGRRAAFGPTLALTATLAFAACALLISAVMIVVEPQPIRALYATLGLYASQRQGAETALYLAGFGVILPIAAVAVPRLANTIAAGPNAAALSALAGFLSATLAAAIVFVRLSDVLPRGGGMRTLLVAALLWAIAGAGILARAAQPRPWRALLRIAGLAPHLWAAAAVLVIAALLTVTHLDSLSPLPLVLGATLIPALVLLAERHRSPRLHGAWRVGAEALIIALLLLATVDLVIVTPEDPGSLAAAVNNGIVQFHHDFLLGPANQVLGGHAMLVDSGSQYGVGSILFLVGWFNLAPIGYGTFGFLDGAVTALAFVAGYCVLRIAGVSRVLAASALGVAVVALVLNRVYPVGALPQEGPLRFGLPLALIVVTVAGARWSRHARSAHAAGLAVLGVSSIWSAEAFAFTAATFTAMTCFRAYLLPPGGRLRWLARQAGLAGAACLSVHLIFAAATLAGTGEVPDWGQYLAYLDVFLFGRLGDVTYDFNGWSPGLAVGAGYLASAAALVLLIRERANIVRRERVALLALTGTTAYGVVIFGYLVDRSMDHVVPYISLPALLIGTLWLSLVLRSPQSLPRGGRAGVLAFALSVALLLVAVAWSSLGARFEHSALAHAIPGGESPRAALDRLWHFPPFKGAAPEGERLLDRYMPRERRTVVLAEPDLTTEILLRSGRVNRLPIGYPWGDTFVARERVPGLLDALAELRPGDRVLLDGGALDALAAIRDGPAFDALLYSGEDTALQSSLTAPVQDLALQKLDERFRLRPIHKDDEGFTVVQLEARA
jgi:hypothetical protein